MITVRQAATRAGCDEWKIVKAAKTEILDGWLAAGRLYVDAQQVDQTTGLGDEEESRLPLLEWANRHGVATHTAYRMCHRGEIDAVQVDRRWWVSPSSSASRARAAAQSG